MGFFKKLFGVEKEPERKQVESIQPHLMTNEQLIEKARFFAQYIDVWIPYEPGGAYTSDTPAHWEKHMRNPAKCQEMLDHIKSKELLITLSTNEIDTTISSYALNSLFKVSGLEQSTLSQIAINSIHSGNAQNASNRVTDPVLIIKIALESRHSYVRRYAIEKIDDQDILLKIALQDKDNCGYAVNRITNQDSLLQIYKSSNENGVRYTIVQKLKNQSVLEAIAMNPKEMAYIRILAMNDITNQIVFETMVSDKTTDLEVRKAAINRINNVNILSDITKGNDDYNLRALAEKRLKDITSKP